MSAPEPLWMAAPSRFAMLPAKYARVIGAGVIFLLLGALTALFVPDVALTTGNAKGADPQSDIALYEGIVAAIAHGESYYRAAADALRAGNYPLRPFLTFRMPGLAVLQGVMPAWAMLGALFLLVLAVVWVWVARINAALPRWPARIVAIAMLAFGMVAFSQPALIAFHEIWAGLLIALSLGLRKPGRWVEAAAIGAIAMLLRETAALYVVIMGGIAFFEGHRREAFGWMAALILFFIALVAHAVAVHGVTGPLDATSPGWSGMHGFGLFVRAMTLATGLQLLPTAIAALFVALALIGWASWRDPLALRAAVVFAAYAVVISLFARLDTFYWGLVIAPTFLIGLVFAPDGLRDLYTRALDRRRVVVRKIER